MQLDEHQTTGASKSISGAQTQRARKLNGQRHKAIMRIGHSGFCSSLESDSKWWILAMTFVQGLLAVLLILGAIYVWKM